VISLEKALAIVDETLRGRRVATETVSVRDAAGRTLAADQVSAVDVPPFDKAAMDGYAVPPGNSRDGYRLEGVFPAGTEETVDLTLAPGTTAKVMTGAPVPPGTERVVKLEEAIEKDGYVRFENPSPAINICRKAEDIAVGDTIVKAGTRIGALEIANLVGGGVTDVEVARRVRVAVISTGDEIVDSPSLLTPGKILNMNGPLLHELSREAGLDVVREVTVTDDRDSLVAELRRSVNAADVVVLTGGVSVGDFDLVPESILEMGFDIHFSRVAIKPGKPLTFATGGDGVLFGLPGNPVAAFLTFHLFILRAAALLSGTRYELKTFKARLAEDLAVRAGTRTAFIPARISRDGLVERVTYHGTAHLAALMSADGFMVLPGGVSSLAESAEVSLMTFERERS
jgi:molybdopterin molybdotransferase